ncbi:hypothetical protein [Listeria phage List-36]|uniref:Uncharacterized protein n=20 Tax=Pecentumvirus TaxID=1857844 RepID=S4UC75_9CAUD|nr:portal protein [Listeria phage A511]YP_007676741.1 portal protein [Listeria phage vB_LmoM_AG20]YP_008240062.1 hypothetical protein QLX35_gp168 [Listeria phage LP-125]YP_009042889.1 portal protein [Listeria phage LP-048]YP_009043090.1 portal protein [Listeria phage LMSP-25]YP_009043470.1 portal protein [Listeria phage List-36]YP_009044552.1 portal protein [Listeria phage LP-083-2]YP_009055674.1 portal protein [Listeria phage LMTA-148]YP_009592629.1 portal protein [Listeria phage LP-064]Y
MSYTKDSLWLETKKVARDNGFLGNWIEMVDYYESIGGSHVFVYAVMEGQKYRILGVLSTDEVLLLKRDLTLSKALYEDVMNSKKMFFYKEDSEKKKIKLTDEISKLEDKDSIIVYM